MRTEELRDFDRKLSTINKNFSHGLFLSEQFLIDNAQLIVNRGEAFSRDVNTRNSYREKFNYRLKSLPDEIKEYQKASRLLKNSFPKLISKEEGVVMVSFLFSKDFEEKRLL